MPYQHVTKTKTVLHPDGRYETSSSEETRRVPPEGLGRKAIDIINEKNATKKPWVAFEYYPPRTDKGTENLLARMVKMKEQGPAYGDMTWGAGGSTSDLTLELCTKMLHDIGMEPNMHLTCTNMEESKIHIALDGCKKVGIRNIVALRGDPPHGQDKWEATEGGFSCALDLVKYIRAQYGDYFCISTAGYPEGHPNVILPVEDESKLTESELTRVVRNSDGVFVCSDADYEKEMKYLKAKVDAGADFIITQMFFEAKLFSKFVKDCRAYGINVPIMPGIMLIQSFGGFKRMTQLCKSRVPAELMAAIDAIPNNDKDEHAQLVKEFGIQQGAKLCRELIADGHVGLHMYSLNLEYVTYGVMKELGLFKE
jgi:methylenetetrahydrofolate reductase (NADPH)